MLTKSYIVQTKLVPPRLTRRILVRKRVTQRLLEALDYRLTIVQAGAGYGKTTALAGLVESGTSIAWYHLSSEDYDPITFVLHLAHSLKKFITDPKNITSVLETFSRNPAEANLRTIIDELSNRLADLQQPLLVIWDDFHQIAESSQIIPLFERLIVQAPADIHFILSTRSSVKFPALSNLKVRGDVLFINQNDLVFTPQEITSLFQEHYAFVLNPEEVTNLASETEGWAIALQLFWQRLKSSSVKPFLQSEATSTLTADELFHFLAQEVFEQLSPDVQAFLRTTAILREMNASVCDELRKRSDSEIYLKHLLENGLFVIDLGGNIIRYHHMFREFILNQLTAELRTTLHQQAAQNYLAHGMDEEAIYHLLKAGKETEAAQVIARIGENLILSGRLATLNKWITSFSPLVLEAHPILLVFLGDFARLHSRFEEALGWYRQAEERSRLAGDTRSTSQALHGQAKVYLDTVNPAQADQLLQKALLLADGTEDRENRARLLELLAENKLNSGKLVEAENYRKQARELREIGPAEVELSVRVLLRTGKLEQARRILEARLVTEKSAPFPTPRSHRETLLLLALILEFQGEGQTAYQYAAEGIARGESMQSPFVIAVGKMRLAHAAMIKEDHQGYLEAVACYKEAIQIADTLSVPRLKVEALWGFTRAYGFKNQLDLALSYANEGIIAGSQAGDEWISALILISMGAGFSLSEKYEQAMDWLERAREKFNKVSDSYGETLALLWQCLVWWKTNQLVHLEKNLDHLLRNLHDHGYDFLLTRQTLLGPPDPRVLIPLLLHARSLGLHRPFIETVLYSLGLSSITLHPGYQLRVQTLGTFRVWRGKQEVEPGEWKREKARQLFLILVTHRNSPMERDQLIELLWPGAEIEFGQRNFRVALSTLLRVLVPSHTRDAESVFIVREGTTYSLRANSDMWIDSGEFEQLVTLGENQPENQMGMRLSHFQQALTLYQGDYLQENLFDSWCNDERERLLSIYLRTAVQLAQLQAQKQDWQKVVDTCQAILERDNCWEEAYRLLMKAYTHLGNKPAALRTYHKCVDILKQELGLQPSMETQDLFSILFNPSG